MGKKFFYAIIAAFLLYGTAIKAQDDDSLSNSERHNWRWHWDWEDNWGGWIHGKPSIEVNYGLGQPKHDKLNSKLTKVGLSEIKIGNVSFDEIDENVVEFNEKYGFISRMATSLQNGTANISELNSDLLRFGVGKRSGYGYDFNNVKILPYNEVAAVWSKLDMKDYPVSILPVLSIGQAENDTQILDRYNNEFRFGTLNEGGIRLEVGRFMSLNAAYEAAVVFPRHLVWKHAASFIIESIGEKALDNFVDEVLDSSPAAAPIVNFLLKNGYSYLFYTLKKDRMNWPFKTETPLTYETFKFGVMFTF